MAKLYFRYGTVGSAKTLNLLAVAHNYKQQGKRVLLLKPDLDDRFGKQNIKSRAGLEQEADLLVKDSTVVTADNLIGVDCVLVDEVQFLSESFIEQLRQITWQFNIPVICYGLRTDFKSLLFEGSRRLLELADSIEEIKTTCAFCNKKGVMNLKHVDGLAVEDGPSIELGAEEKYFPSCYKCYKEQLQAAREGIQLQGKVVAG